MPFAGHQHDVAAPRFGQRATYRLPPVDDLFMFAAHAPGDLHDDRRRIFAARIVAGDDQVIGMARGDLAHQRPLAAIAVAAAAKHAEQTSLAARHRTQTFEHFFQRVWCMRVIDNDQRRAAAAVTFGASRHWRDHLQRCNGLLKSDIADQQRRQRTQQVGRIEAADQRAFQRRLPPR